MIYSKPAPQTLGGVTYIKNRINGDLKDDFPQIFITGNRKTLYCKGFDSIDGHIYHFDHFSNLYDIL